MFEIEDYFSIQIFFIILRETLESAIIISVLLSFINQRSHKSDANSTPSKSNTHLQQVQRKLKIQVWIGALLGLVICFLIGLIFILAFYFVGKDYWAYTERVWEGVFSILSSIIITVMGIGLLRINKVMKLKWWIKLGDAYNNEGDEEGEEEIAKLGDDDVLPDEFSEHDVNDRVNSYGENRSSSESESAPLTASSQVPVTSKKSPAKRRQKFGKKYFLAILPLVTTLREGLEAVVFVGGIGVSSPPSSFPLSIACGLTLGALVGYTLYKGGNKLSLQYFLITSTCFLYIVSAGLMSRGVWFLELESFVRKCGGLDVSETGSGPGSYDIAKSVWHVNCCNGLTDGGWMVLNAIFGWTNSATYGSVTTYFAYWFFVIIWLNIKLYEEREGVLPLVPIKWQLKRIRKKIRLYELRNSQSLHTIEQSQQEEGVVEAEQQGLLE
ncbi:Fth2 iron transporter [Candida orthopsilosis Co 90-125]|uniref:Fth2 iron transporter n=1 Tax=Candida orthopsilosis (strain 90-125) TaxID=1136231 RepID=H8WW77_CANO9|nr:Fth2 iron transporter [Candida orthopsilosis Co 90-125]CCG20701.1 Fth2 iron transporter [Candida orthopsilosis Co 90-125]